MLPADYVWLEPVLIAAIIVFVIDYFSNLIQFGSRLANALVTAILFAVVFGVLIYLGYGNMTISVPEAGPAATP